MSRRPFAAFDIDGTLIRWQLYHAVVEQLGKQGLIAPGRYRDIRDARMVWKRRTGEASFKEYERLVVEVYDETLQGLHLSQVMDAMQLVMDEYKDQTYVYTRDLIRSLQDQGYLLFAVSASQHEIVGQLAAYYGFDDWAGSRYENDGDRFTGSKDVLKRDKKPEVLKLLAARHQADWQGSIAVGDSDSDIQMLSAVNNPIAFNPNKELFRHAREHGWKIVVERKNMYYELEPAKEPTDGSAYLLAQTNA